MKWLPNIFSAIAACASFASHAQVLQESEFTTDAGEVLVQRTVSALAQDGEATEVVQILRRLPDGNLEYIPSLQPAATREFDRLSCEGNGEPASDRSIVIWSPATIHGVSCTHTGEWDGELPASGTTALLP